MKVGVLLCDQVREEYQGRFGQYQDMIIAMLAPFFPRLEFTCFRCDQGEIPSDPHAFDFYISSGSRQSVYDDEPWIKALMTFIQQLDQLQKKFIGICFGHQLIALALNGKVERSDKGWGIGVATHDLLMQPDWMRYGPKQFSLIVSHQDQVVEIPSGTQVIAGNPFCPYFLVQWNSHFLSVQGHPEWSIEYARTLFNDRRESYPQETFEQAIESLHKIPDSNQFNEWVKQFIDRINP